MAEDVYNSTKHESNRSINFPYGKAETDWAECVWATEGEWRKSSLHPCGLM